MTNLKYIFTYSCLAFVFTAAQVIYAEANIELNIVAKNLSQKTDTKADKSKKKKSKKSTETVKPDRLEALPGDELVYTIYYENLGEHAAVDAQLNSAINKDTIYKPASAQCEKCMLVFSVDDGENFKLVDKMDAKPESYTHIRWLMDEIAAGEKGQVSYSVIVR